MRAAISRRSVTFHVFGPGMSDTDWALFEGHPKATYRGVLAPEEVPRVLSEHDLLLFPSYYPGEGHPGVILEAFQCGLPVIAAKWRAVPELVEHEENGLLVEPRSAGEVRSAIARLLGDPDLYRRLCEGAARPGRALSKRQMARSHGCGPARPLSTPAQAKADPAISGPKMCGAWRPWCQSGVPVASPWGVRVLVGRRCATTAANRRS